MDPIFDVTLAPLARYCAAVWGGELQLARLQRAWQALEQARLTTKPTWHGARGPLAAMWMSLLRIGWTMHSSLVLVTDAGALLELLRVPPKEVREGNQRWQGRQILRRHDEPGPPPTATLWHRAMRLILAPPRAVLRGARAGQLRKLWAGASWDAVKRRAKGDLASPWCPYCPGQQKCTKGHQFHVRPRVLNVGQQEGGHNRAARRRPPAGTPEAAGPLQHRGR